MCGVHGARSRLIWEFSGPSCRIASKQGQRIGERFRNRLSPHQDHSQEYFTSSACLLSTVVYNVYTLYTRWQHTHARAYVYWYTHPTGAREKEEDEQDEMTKDVQWAPSRRFRRS